MKAMKKLLSILLVVSLVLCLAACGGEQPVNNDDPAGSQTDDNGGTDVGTTQGNTTTDDANKKTIVCFGASIVEGMAMEKQHTFPSVLKANLNGQYNVINAGCGGEDSFTVSTRANAVDFTLTNDLVFEKGETEVSLNAMLFSGFNGENVKYRYSSMGNELPITKLTIDGKPYTMRFEKGINEETNEYIICREDASESLTIPVGAQVKYDYSDYFDELYCTIVLMGANDQVKDINLLIERYKKIAATSEKFIALIPHYSTDYTAEFEAAFGDACVNLREYCKEQVWIDYDYEKTQSDDICISEGVMPRQFTYQRKKGDPHLNEEGYKILGDLIYKKGVELGYWN